MITKSTRKMIIVHDDERNYFEKHLECYFKPVTETRHDVKITVITTTKKTTTTTTKPTTKEDDHDEDDNQQRAVGDRCRE